MFPHLWNTQILLTLHFTLAYSSSCILRPLFGSLKGLFMTYSSLHNSSMPIDLWLITAGKWHVFYSSERRFIRVKSKGCKILPRKQHSSVWKPFADALHFTHTALARLAKFSVSSVHGKIQGFSLWISKITTMWILR